MQLQNIIKQKTGTKYKEEIALVQNDIDDIEQLKTTRSFN